MRKHRVSTTISEKHWEMLKKHTEKFESQQKVLEFALESMENNSGHAPVLSIEEDLRMRSFKELKGSVVVIHKEQLKALLEEAINIDRIGEKIKKGNTVAYLSQWYYKKPIKRCTLKEILEVTVTFFKAGNLIDDVSYMDNGSFYTLSLLHSMNRNCSEFCRVILEGLFENYGAKYESEVFENTIFTKIYKNP
ncbi:Uncharacterised protein [uncultured archaeon]|nr:Uncharacterised protein [uncultured archaeon]